MFAKHFHLIGELYMGLSMWRQRGPTRLSLLSLKQTCDTGFALKGSTWITGLIHPGVPSICSWHLLCGLRSLSDDVIPCLSLRLPHEGNSAALTSAVKAQGRWVCWAKTETSGCVMLRKLPVTVTLYESPSKEISDHNTLCFAMLCCPIDSCLFSLCYWLFQHRQWCQD